MEKTRTGAAKKNIISGTINKTINLLLPFIFRSVLINVLGEKYLGLGTLFSSILQVLNMAELGFSSAVTFSLYRPLAEHDTTTVCAYLSYFKRVYRLIGMVIFFGGILITPFVPYLIKGSTPEEVNIYALFLLYLLNTVISYLLWGYKSVLLSAAQERHVIDNIDTILGIGKYSIQIFAIILFENYYIVVVVIILSTVVNNIALKCVCDNKYPEFCNVEMLTDLQKKEVQKLVGGVTIGKISNTARNSLDSVLLSVFCGLSTVAIYSNYYMVLNSVLAFYVVLTEGIAAGVGDCIATESKEKNYQDFKKFLFVFSWIGSFCTICLLCLYQDFMKIWMGQSRVVDNLTMILFVLYFYILQMGQLRAVYSRASGIWWKQKYLAVGETIANLALNLALGYIWGMNGILVATLITVTVFSIIGIGKLTINICFNRSSKEYFMISILWAAGTSMLAIVMWGITHSLPFDGILKLVVSAIVCCILPNLVILLIAINNVTLKRYLSDICTKIFLR